jgi:hypothetical protein
LRLDAGVATSTAVGNPGNPETPDLAQRRAAGRQRWHKWAARRRAGRATCPVEYDGAVLGKLVLKGWLPRSDTYSPKAIGRAVTDLIAHGDLPRRKIT